MAPIKGLVDVALSAPLGTSLKCHSNSRTPCEVCWGCHWPCITAWHPSLPNLASPNPLPSSGIDLNKLLKKAPTCRSPSQSLFPGKHCILITKLKNWVRLELSAKMHLLRNGVIPFINREANHLFPKRDHHSCSGSHIFSSTIASLQTSLHPLPQVSYISQSLNMGVPQGFVPGHLF